MNINDEATSLIMRRLSLQTVGPFGNSISTSFVILPLAHVVLCNAAVQLLVFDDEARIRICVH